MAVGDWTLWEGIVNVAVPRLKGSIPPTTYATETNIRAIISKWDKFILWGT